MSQPRVSDDVWRQLDPYAGALNRRQRRRAVAAAWLATIVMMAGYAIYVSGSVWARVGYSRDFGAESTLSTDFKVFTLKVPVKNTGWTTIRITGIGQDRPGLQPIGPGDAEGTKQLSEMGGQAMPFELRPGQTAIVAAAYRVTDCEALSTGPLPLTVHIDRPWGTETISVSLPFPYEPSLGTPFSPLIGWQKAAAACASQAR